jgi:hypothetical protein
MKCSQIARAVLAASLALGLSVVSASTALATTDIRDEPGGKRLLFVDGDAIRSEPGGKRLVFIDGNTLRDEPGGKVLLVVDGDDVRTEAGGERKLYIDGNDIRDEPGGKRLLYVDGNDIRDEPGGKRLLFVDGDALTRPQLVAVLYLYFKPEKQGGEAVPADAKPKDELAQYAGTYGVTSFKSSDDANAKLEGDVVFTRAGEGFTYTGPGFKGAAFFFDDNLLCADGDGRSAAALLTKGDDGKYTGTGMNADGEAAKVTLTSIGDGKWNLEAADEKGHGEKLVVKRVEWSKPLEGDIDTFKIEVVPEVGQASRDPKDAIQGVGFEWHGKLFIGLGNGAGIGVVKLRIDGDNVMGDFVTAGGTTGQVGAAKKP